MSTRALRRALNNQDVATLKDAQNDNDEEVSSDEKEQPRIPSKFSADILDDYFGNSSDETELVENTPKSEAVFTTQKQSNSAVRKKKRKKKKNERADFAQISEMRQESVDTDEELDNLIAENSRLLAEDPAAAIKNELMGDLRNYVASSQAQQCLSIDARFLSAENEMVRMFGSEVLRNMNKNKRSHKQVQNRNSFKLAKYPANSPPVPNTGLSMTMTHKEADLYTFRFVHSKEYQKAQQLFWVATRGMQHEGLMRLLQDNWFHLDTLIQASNLFRMNDDTQNASTLIERALCIAEAAFHPLFSITSGKSRLPYKYPENRALYLAMFHQIHFLAKKGCHRTSLEFCKLILSLSPDEDPLSILFLIDVCALMSKQYKWLLNFYSVWNPLKNLYQLPNFAYSVPLAQFLLLQETSQEVNAEVDMKLEDALIAFPSVLPELLHLCNIDADSKTERNRYFGMSADANQLAIVTQMCKLYAHRVHHIWKQPEVMKWLEVCTRKAIGRVNSRDPLVEKSKTSRKTLYKGTPRNVYRHFILSDVKEVPVSLPVELQSQPLYSYDPLPPLDTESSYERPPSPRGQARYPQGRNILSSFLEALMPLYGIEQEALNQAGVRGFEVHDPIEVVGQRIPNPNGDGADPQGVQNAIRDQGDLMNEGDQGAVRENLLEMLRNWMRGQNEVPFEDNVGQESGDDQGAVGGYQEGEQLTQEQLDENLALQLQAAQFDSEDFGDAEENEQTED